MNQKDWTIGVLIIIFIVLIVGSFIVFNIKDSEQDILEEKIFGLQKLVQENESLIKEGQGFLEAKNDCDKRYIVKRDELEEIQGVYSDLFTDASSCYWANYCLYNEVGCVEALGQFFPGDDYLDIHIAESNFCDEMYRDWDKYQSFDVELNGGN